MSEVLTPFVPTVHQHTIDAASGTHADWGIGPNRNAPQVFAIVTCMDCQQSSASEDPIEPQKWAIGHTVQTCHPTFSLDRRSFLEVLQLPKEGQ